MSALWRVLVQNAAGNRGTPIDWCEANYAVSPHVAEFYNTASSACYVVAGLSCLRRARAHAPLRRDGHFTLAAIAIILTGVFSAWFHATLTWRSQKADEAAENAALVLLMRASQGAGTGTGTGTGTGAGTGTHGGVGGGGELARGGGPWLLASVAHVAAATAAIFSISSFLFCELHLISMVVALLRQVGRITHDHRGLRPRALAAALMGLLGFACWLVDRLACGALEAMHGHTGLGNPQLHAWWHVLTALALHEAFYVAAVAALHRAHSQQPFGLPPATRFAGLVAVMPASLPHFSQPAGRQKEKER